MRPRPEYRHGVERGIEEALGVLTATPLSARRFGRASIGLAVACLLVACSVDERRSEGFAQQTGRLTEPPSIVLVTIDTLRADHVSAYGYFRDTTPHLDALAAEGVLFERAVATMATTLPSHLSALTGLYPHQHGLLQNRVRGRPFQSAEGRRSVAELLRDDGYTTAAFISGASLKRLSGVNAGFDEFIQPKGYDRRAERTIDLVLPWLERHGSEKFFLWVHLWDPHEPNKPRGDWGRRYGDTPELDALIDERSIDSAALKELFAPPALRRFLTPGVGRSGPVPEVDREDLRNMLNRYDGDVAYTDHHLGRLFAELRRLGLWQRSVVAVMGDHGQSLGQHAWLPHGRITNENVLVPMIVRFPPEVAVAGTRIRSVVSIVDLFPTILARFESEASRRFLAQAEGQDILSESFDRPYAFAQRTVRERSNWAPGLRFTLVGERWKFILSTEGRDQLFDLQQDPGELLDVSDEYPDVVADLRRRLQKVVRRRPATPDDGSGPPVPPEYLKALESLGYVGDG